MPADIASSPGGWTGTGSALAEKAVVAALRVADGDFRDWDAIVHLGRTDRRRPEPSRRPLRRRTSDQRHHEQENL